PPETRARINRLVSTLLERYHVTEPPVPVDRMLKQPLDGLWDVHPSQISFIMGHGIYRYAPRLAEARLLYRMISESIPARQAGLDAPWPTTRRTIKYFARCLLMPEEWVRARSPADRTPDAVSEIFQVTSYDAVIRLAELGLPVPADVVIPSDE
ncbi:MAG TPA: hypothetical protein VLG46_15460, partial [Anaerolineae bacterium]|nr:hypothetical protein [Anaerolineae bacterium]